MIKNLFTKNDHRVFSGITKEQAAEGAAWYWRSRQFGVSFSSPYALMGTQFYSKLGLRQQVLVSCFDMAPGVGVDVAFSAELTDEGAVVGAVGAVLVLPLVVAVGAVSYIEYENDANRMISDFWTYMSSYCLDRRPPQGSPPVPEWAGSEPHAGAVPGTDEPVPKCSGCGTTADQDSKFCRHCGTKL